MMTRKDAMMYAIKTIEANCDKGDGNAINAINKLTECINALPDVGWSQEKILDTCRQYCKDNNTTFLCSSDFKGKKMPAAANIERHFKMSVSEFIYEYFTQPEGYSSALTYQKADKEKLLKNFKEEMEILHAVSRTDYDRKRRKSSPVSVTLMRLFEVETWTELKKLAGVKDYKNTKNIIVESNSRLHNNQYEKKDY